ncbi:MAG: hypothetical protein ACTMIR_11530 [Cellulomonadaceae bacterium]
MPDSPRNPHDTSSAPSPADPAAPRALGLVVVLIGLECLALLAAGGASVVDAVTGGRVALALTLALLAWGMALVLVIGVRGLLRGVRAARSPVLTWQLFQIVVGVTVAQSGQPVAGAVLVAVAVAVAVGLLLPAVVAATTRDSRPTAH